MSRANAPGPKPKWGGLVTVSIRWPAPHRKLYVEQARERGMSFSEYIARVVAEAHGLEMPEDTVTNDQQELPLTA